jgi:hypothetical protein
MAAISKVAAYQNKCGNNLNIVLFITVSYNDAMSSFISQMFEAFYTMPFFVFI